MPDWLISTPDSVVWQVWVADCDREHAESVLSSLENDSSVPGHLVLEQRPLHDLPLRVRARRRFTLWRK